MFSLFLFKQETAYEVRISDWSSDVCSSDLFEAGHGIVEGAELARGEPVCPLPQIVAGQTDMHPAHRREMGKQRIIEGRSEEHTSELQSLLRISYAVFCLKKKKIITEYQTMKCHTTHTQTLVATQPTHKQQLTS